MQVFYSDECRSSIRMIADSKFGSLQNLKSGVHSAEMP